MGKISKAKNLERGWGSEKTACTMLVAATFVGNGKSGALKLCRKQKTDIMKSFIFACIRKSRLQFLPT